MTLAPLMDTPSGVIAPILSFLPFSEIEKFQLVDKRCYIWITKPEQWTDEWGAKQINIVGKELMVIITKAFPNYFHGARLNWSMAPLGNHPTVKDLIELPLSTLSSPPYPANVMKSAGNSYSLGDGSSFEREGDVIAVDSKGNIFMAGTKSTGDNSIIVLDKHLHLKAQYSDPDNLKFSNDGRAFDRKTATLYLPTDTDDTQSITALKWDEKGNELVFQWKCAIPEQSRFLNLVTLITLSGQVFHVSHGGAMYKRDPTSRQMKKILLTMDQVLYKTDDESRGRVIRYLELDSRKSVEPPTTIHGVTYNRNPVTQQTKGIPTTIKRDPLSGVWEGLPTEEARIGDLFALSPRGDLFVVRQISRQKAVDKINLYALYSLNLESKTTAFKTIATFRAREIRSIFLDSKGSLMFIHTAFSHFMDVYIEPLRFSDKGEAKSAWRYRFSSATRVPTYICDPRGIIYFHAKKGLVAIKDDDKGVDNVGNKIPHWIFSHKFKRTTPPSLDSFGNISFIGYDDFENSELITLDPKGEIFDPTSPKHEKAVSFWGKLIKFFTDI